MIDNDSLTVILFRTLGAFMGVLASLIMIAPEGTKNALYRVLVGVSMGVVFAPIAWRLPFLGFLEGPDNELILARGAAMGFLIWFLLELIARLLSSNDWLVSLIKEFVRIRSRGDDQ